MRRFINPAQLNPKANRPKRDLSDQCFGRWRVLDFAGRTRMGAAYWICLCACGTTRLVEGSPLTIGTSRSCGCAQQRSHDGSKD